MSRKRSDPLFVPRTKYMDKQFIVQLTQEQRDKLGQLARRSKPKPMSAGAWVRKQIDMAEL